MCNEIKISFDVPRFYINEGNGIVKSTLNGVLIIPESLAKSLGIPSQTKVAARGVSTCLHSDDFNEYTGRKISLAKAENKAYRRAVVKIKKAWLKINDESMPKKKDDIFGVKTCCSTINTFYSKANHSITHNEKYIKRIGK